MDKKDYFVKSPITGELIQPKQEESQFYLEEMQRMNNQMIDMQRDLNRALRESRQMQDQLRHSDELKKSLEISEKANQAKMDFMSRMSHDLRTPMNVIMGLVAATLDEADNPDLVRSNMANIRSASDYMLGLVNDILDMAQVEKGNVELKLEPYSYSEFVFEMKTMFQAQCDAKSIQFICNELPADPVVMADKLRLKQVLFNILSNAVKYTQPGGSISVDARILQTNSSADSLSMEYRVIDTGVGMSQDFQDHLFEPFTQEDNTISPELKGSGLGLSITKRLVDRMGGTIDVDSQKNKGTIVIVTLPFSLAPHHESRESSEEMQSAEYSAILQGKKLLLAEDHPLSAMIAKNLLEKKQVNVLLAENGKIAVELFQASPAGSLDAVLLDIRMPEMTGLEAASAIRALDRADAETVPIIALSANTYASDIQASLDAGMNAHLAKPIDATTLYRTLAKFLQNKE